MIRTVLPFLLFISLLATESHAQLRIDQKVLKSHFDGTLSSQDEETRKIDTLFVGSLNTGSWKSYTARFGKDVEFGVFITLPDPGFRYRLVSWNLPFYGGGYQSGGLREAGLSSRVWADTRSHDEIIEDSILIKTSPKSFKIGAFEYRIADFAFSSAPYWEGSKSVALSILYESGPDSLGISPIWTEDKMSNDMFYSRMVPLTDSTSERKFFNHTDFWNLYKTDASKFGQLSGYLLVEIDTTKSTGDPDDSKGPLGTSLNEKWYLPGSHRVIENFPNPFNPTTTLQIMPQITGDHDVRVYDLARS